jgi:hypothetical protein
MPEKRQTYPDRRMRRRRDRARSRTFPSSPRNGEVRVYCAAILVGAGSGLTKGRGLLRCRKWKRNAVRQMQRRARDATSTTAQLYTGGPSQISTTSGDANLTRRATSAQAAVALEREGHKRAAPRPSRGPQPRSYRSGPISSALAHVPEPTIPRTNTDGQR